MIVGGYVIDIIPTKYDVFDKGVGLKKIAEIERLSTNQCVFVGDNKNDIFIDREAGFSIDFNSKSGELNKISDIIMSEKDLTQILPHII